MKRLISFLFALTAFSALSVPIAEANHETTGLFQGRTPCPVNPKGEPVKVTEKDTTVAQCLVVGMPGYPDQVWVFVEQPDGEVLAVYVLDKDFNVLKTVWKAGTPI